MAAVSSLTINLEYADLGEGSGKAKAFYRPGDNVEGVVVLVLNSSIRVTNLTLSVGGMAKTAWEVKDKKKTYQDSETYLNQVEPLLDPDTMNGIFPKGAHRFAFRVFLPHSLPSTFNGTFGSVAYMAMASLESDDDIYNTMTQIPFMVLRRDRLPSPAYEPAVMADSKTFLGLPLGKISVDCSLDHAIAVPGGVINVNATVQNRSGKDITLLEGALIMDSKYRARDKQVEFRQYLGKREDFFDVNLQWGRKWTDVKVQIPPYLPDSGLQCCNLIAVKYTFQYRVKIKGHEDIVVETPVYVGYHEDVEEANPKGLLMERMFRSEPRDSLDFGQQGFYADLEEVRAGRNFLDHGPYQMDHDLQRQANGFGGAETLMASAQQPRLSFGGRKMFSQQTEDRSFDLRGHRGVNEPEEPMYGLVGRQAMNEPEEPLYGLGGRRMFSRPEEPVFGLGGRTILNEPEEPLYGLGGRKMLGQTEEPMYGLGGRKMFGQTDEPAYGLGGRKMLGQTDEPVYGLGGRKMFGQMDEPAYGLGGRKMSGQMDEPAYGLGGRKMSGQVEEPVYGLGDQRRSSNIEGQGQMSWFGGQRSGNEAERPRGVLDAEESNYMKYTGPGRAVTSLRV